MTFEPVVDSRPDDAPWPTLRWPPEPDVVLTGRLVELRPADPARDAADLFAALDDDAIWRHVAGRPRDPDGWAVTIRQRVDLGWLPWVVRLHTAYRGIPAGAVVGSSSYLEVAVADARLEIGATTYVPALWGSALNPDTKLTLLRYAFDQLGAGRVQLKTDVRNSRSQRAIERLGAAYEGTLRRYQRRADDTVRDTVLFSIIAEDWPSIQVHLEARLADSHTDKPAH